MSSDKSNQLLIREAIRKIALGRSMERINLAPGGMSGIGTARMIHGYVAKIHDNPSDEEFSDYGGTIDVGEYPDETASAEPVIHKGVLLSASLLRISSFTVLTAVLLSAPKEKSSFLSFHWFWCPSPALTITVRGASSKPSGSAMQTLPSCSVFAVKKTAPSSVKTRTSAPRAGLPPWKLVSTQISCA